MLHLTKQRQLKTAIWLLDSKDFSVMSSYRPGIADSMTENENITSISNFRITKKYM